VEIFLALLRCQWARNALARYGHQILDINSKPTYRIIVTEACRGSKLLPIKTEGNTGDGARMSLQAYLFLSGSSIPHFHGFIRAGRRKNSSRRIESNVPAFCGSLDHPI